MSTQGVVDVRSQHSVKDTIDRLAALVARQGLLVFARIDYGGDAARAGLALRPAQMLLFGNPRAGTPLLAAAPRVGLDLPLKALAWEDEAGRVWVSLNDPEYIGHRHALPPGMLVTLAPARALVEAAAAPA